MGWGNVATETDTHTHTYTHIRAHTRTHMHTHTYTEIAHIPIYRARNLQLVWAALENLRLKRWESKVFYRIFCLFFSFHLFIYLFVCLTSMLPVSPRGDWILFQSTFFFWQKDIVSNSDASSFQFKYNNLNLLP